MHLRAVPRRHIQHRTIDLHRHDVSWQRRWRPEASGAGQTNDQMIGVLVQGGRILTDRIDHHTPEIGMIS
jgi:hypothetical protein